MASIPHSLLDAAASALSVTDLGAMGTPGGQKAVRRVQKANGEVLVMKVIALPGEGSPELKRARREVSLLAEHSHPSLVRVASELVEISEPSTGAAWLEELLDGQDLSDEFKAVDSKPWQWSAVRAMAIQIAEGLGCAHKLNVVHRDLSAANVSKLADGTYKVLDFGFAKFGDLSSLTTAGQPGTYGYLSPEHFHPYSGGPSFMSDVFQLGQLLFRALSGQFPFPFSGDRDAYQRALLTNTRPNLAELRPDLPPEVVRLVDRMLHPQPARRFRNGDELVTALRSIS